MSTSLIYHGFGVYGYKYFKTEYREGKIFIHIKKKPEYQYCADCKSRNVARKGHIERELKTLPIGKKNVYIVLHLHLSDWLKKAWVSGISLVKKFANMIAAHRVGILNYLHIPVTTGPVEGINNKIKVLKRKAYGYRDVEYFKLRIYFLHESRYALIG